MKRLITRPRWKRHLREQQLSAERASVRKKRHAIERHEAHYGMPSSKTETKKHLGQPAQMVAPKRFSMVENPDEAVHFLNRIRAVARARDLFIDLEEVEELTPDAVALLLATINRRELANNTFVSGNHPKDSKLRAILTNSGFREYVRSHPESAPKMELGRIRRRPKSSETVDDSVKGAVAAELIEFAMQKLTGFPIPHQPSYRVLGEAMLNTLNHASERPKEYREPWWASVYCNVENHRAAFTFIDQGIGIFKSHGLLFRLRWASKLFLTERTDILRELLLGNIPSRTGLSYHGYGLPGIYDACLNRRIRNLVILSNDVYANVERGNFQALKNSFDGTILYWEVEV